MKFLPTEAYCAIGPDGKIDIDLVRRNQASAQHAAGQVDGSKWLAKAAQGWQVHPVVVTVKGQPLPAEAPAPPPGRKPPPAAKTPRRGLDTPGRMTAAEYNAMVRCGDIR